MNWGQFLPQQKSWSSFILFFSFLHKKISARCPINNFWLYLIFACRLSSSRPCVTGRTSHAFSLWSGRRTIPTGSSSLVSVGSSSLVSEIVLIDEWDRHHWWVRSSSLVSVGSSSLVSVIVSTGEWDCHHWWVGSSSLVSGIVITGEWDIITGEWDRLHWWVISLSLVSEIAITGEWDCHRWWVRSSSLVSEISSLVSGIVFPGEWDPWVGSSLLLNGMITQVSVAFVTLLSVSYLRETLWLLLLTGPVSVSLSFYYLSLISERPCGCCSLRALSLSLSPSIICLLFQRDPVADAPYGPCLCLSLLLLSVSYFRETLLLQLLAGPVSVSVSLCFFYLSLISKRPCGCCSLLALSLYLSPSIICILFQRGPVAAALYGTCHCLSLLLLSVSYFRETLRLMLLTGPVSVSISFYYMSLILEKPCGCCSSLPLSPSFHYCFLISDSLCDYFSLHPVSVSLLKLSVSFFRETLWLLLFTAYVSLVPLFVSYSERLCDVWALSLSLSPTVICLLFQRDLVAAAPLWGKEETDRRLYQ